VSHDQGASWIAPTLDVPRGLGDPILATANGRKAYLFLRAPGALRQYRTTDGGESWQTIDVHLPWPYQPGFDPSEHKVGAVVRSDGSILLWLQDDAATVYLESTDDGLSYHATDGPGGPIVSVADAFVTISNLPQISVDARTWNPLPEPTITSPSF